MSTGLNPGKFPIILKRTPYDKHNMDAADFGVKGASRGYVVINQDVRGRYTSDGEWYPFLHESNDGYDTVEWAASLPYSNGKVGMYGGSYVGATQMLAAIAHPPHLAGICPGCDRKQLSRAGGPTREEPSNNGSMNRGHPALRKTLRSLRCADHANAMNGISHLPLVEYPLFELPQSSSNSDMLRIPRSVFL